MDRPLKVHYINQSNKSHMSSDLATKLSALRTLIFTTRDDITHTREAYSHDALATLPDKAIDFLNFQTVYIIIFLIVGDRNTLF